MTMPGDRRLRFYFDFVSPYAYLAFQRVPELARRHRVAVDYHVVDLAALKHLAGNTAPPTRAMPLKLRWARADMMRWAGRYGVPMTPPAGYGSDRVNKGFFQAAEAGREAEYIAAAWRRIWGSGGDMASETLLREVASEMGWDAHAFLDRIGGAESEAAYRASTDAAHAAGIFGVPTMTVGDQLWWGNDRLDFVEEALAEPQP